LRNRTAGATGAVPQAGGGKAVLCAPTFNAGRSAAALLPDNLVHSIRGDDTDIHILIRPHPHLPAKAPELLERWSREAAAHPNVVLETDASLNLLDLFDGVDLMISDVSSAALAWLALDRPLVCLVNRHAASKSPYFAPDGLEWRMLDCAQVVDDAGVLNSAVQAVFDGVDSGREKRRAFRDYLFGDLQDGLGSKRTAEHIIGHIKGNAP